MTMIKLNKIRIDGGTQIRVRLSEEAVQEYADAMKEGVKLPPVIVFFDGSEHWLADGFHRFHAHKKISADAIQVEQRPGTRREAVAYSLGANRTHGLRRTNEDKRNAVETALADEEWAQWSDRKIANLCGVTHPFVASVRAPKVVTVTTLPATKSDAETVPEVVTVTTHKQSVGIQEEASPQAPTAREAFNLSPAAAEVEHDNLVDSVRALSEENGRLAERLAVEAMDASEEEKAAASELIGELKRQVLVLTQEKDALKATLDALLVTNTELKRSVAHWQRQAKKVAA